eukprot:SAG31_NODE_6272_length_2093_cov_4.616349_1_plen_103_part_00
MWQCIPQEHEHAQHKRGRHCRRTRLPPAPRGTMGAGGGAAAAAAAQRTRAAGGRAQLDWLIGLQLGDAQLSQTPIDRVSSYFLKLYTAGTTAVLNLVRLSVC